MLFSDEDAIWNQSLPSRPQEWPQDESEETVNQGNSGPKSVQVPYATWRPFNSSFWTPKVKKIILGVLLWCEQPHIVVVHMLQSESSDWAINIKQLVPGLPRIQEYMF